MVVEGDDSLAGVVFGADGHGYETACQREVVCREGLAEAEFGFEGSGFGEKRDFVPAIDDNIRAFDIEKERFVFHEFELFGAFAGAAEAADEGVVLEGVDQDLFPLGDVEAMPVCGDGFWGQEVAKDDGPLD